MAMKLIIATCQDAFEGPMKNVINIRLGSVVPISCGVRVIFVRDASAPYALCGCHVTRKQNVHHQKSVRLLNSYGNKSNNSSCNSNKMSNANYKIFFSVKAIDMQYQ